MSRRPALTAMGSWPVVPIERAIDWAFELDIPALPELPGLGPEHDMVGALLTGGPITRAAFWGRVDRRRPPAAKLQGIGPVTLLELARRGEPRLAGLSERELLDRVRARARADACASLDLGVEPLIFLDEPLLSAPSAQLRSLASLAHELRAMGARVGVHCCAPVSWPEALALPLDLLAFDGTQAGWPRPRPEALAGFRGRGGRLVVGAVSVAGALAAPATLGEFGPDFDLSFSCGLAGARPEEVPGLLLALRLQREAWPQPPMF